MEKGKLNILIAAGELDSNDARHILNKCRKEDNEALVFCCKNFVLNTFKNQKVTNTEIRDRLKSDLKIEISGWKLGSILRLLFDFKVTKVSGKAKRLYFIK
tara:strand:- start:7095 stop:7397 length:303 start_codon:yes stop_codon:yes gene_type:complete